MSFFNSTISQKREYVNQDEYLIGIETGTGEILEDRSASGKIRPWSEHKMRNIELVELFAEAKEIDDTIITYKRMTDLANCGKSLLFERDAEGRKHLREANFCRIRVCPMCNWRRSMKLFGQVSAITNAILADKKARFIFVTLTVKNVDGCDLRETLDAMNKAFSYITAKSKTFAPAKVLKQNLLGYMKAIELTYNSKEDTFHPHIHAIFEVAPSYFAGRNYMAKKDWIEIWQKAMKLDYAPSVDVKNIKATASAVAEVAKYPVKLDTFLKIEDKITAAIALIQLYRALFHRRLVTFGGDFREYARKLKLDDVENGDLIHTDNEDEKLNAVGLILYKYHADVGCYIC